MLWVPICASAEDTSESPHPPRIIVTALGGAPFDLEEARMPYILVALGVFACAASALLLTVRSQPDMHPWPDVVARMWSVGTLFLSLCAFLVLAELLMNLPTIMWDAVDDQGRPIFGTVVAQPSIAKKQHPFTTQTRESPHGPEGTERTASRNGCRGSRWPAGC
ncbi:hypothetical protein [Brevibacterium linens]|uniref:hypothetical protein n=1 Tax=Brevibacterium linens TaxID=1703 RepID=UPI000FCCAB9C|nr:hypothetical protein [Brevibacterium linens]